MSGMNYRIDTTEKRTSDLEDLIKVFPPEYKAKSQGKRS